MKKLDRTKPLSLAERKDRWYYALQDVHQGRHLSSDPEALLPPSTCTWGRCNCGGEIAGRAMRGEPWTVFIQDHEVK